jgi:hypothetical protein
MKSKKQMVSTCAVLVLAIALAACGGAAAPPPAATTAAPNPIPTVADGPAPTSTIAPINTPLPAGVVSARDSMVLVINEEPLVMNPFPSQGGIAAAPGKDNTVDPLTWQSGDDQRIVPTTASTGWEQLAPDR